MIYLQGHAVTFQEVPNEITLVLLIGDCPHRCKGCHSPTMQKPEGKDLLTIINTLLNKYGDVITCVCFMGEGQDFKALFSAIKDVKRLGYKVCLYTGYYFGELVQAIRSEDPKLLPALKNIDYVKEGPYIESLGGLDSPTTNQRMCKLMNHNQYYLLVDMTWRFRKKYNERQS